MVCYEHKVSVYKALKMEGSQIRTDETKLYSVPGNAMGRAQLDIFLFTYGIILR